MSDYADQATNALDLASYAKGDNRANRLAEAQVFALLDLAAAIREKTRTAERKPEPTREVRDAAEVVNAHLEEKSA